MQRGRRLTVTVQPRHSLRRAPPLQQPLQQPAPRGLLALLLPSGALPRSGADGSDDPGPAATASDARGEDEWDPSDGGGGDDDHPGPFQRDGDLDGENRKLRKKEEET